MAFDNSNMSQQFDNICNEAVDYNIPFSELLQAGWQFDINIHSTGINNQAFQSLLHNLNVILAANNARCPGEEEFSSHSAAMKFLSRKHTAKWFSIAEFLTCTIPGHRIFSDITMALHKYVFRNVLEAAMTAASNASKLSVENRNNYSVLQTLDSNVKAGQANLKAQSDNLLEDKYNFDLAVQNFELERNNFYNSQQTSGANPANFNNSGQNPRPDNNGYIHSDPAMISSLQNINSNMNHWNQTWVKLVTDKQAKFSLKSNPPKYNSKEHGSLITYASRDYQMWAGENAMNNKDSTLFFYLVFREKKTHKDHVYTMSRDKNGIPTFESAEALAKQIIVELKYSEEDVDALKNMFWTYRNNPRIDCDEEFQRCYELKKAGWPEEPEIDNIEDAKKKFMKKLDLNKNLHNTIYQERNSQEWIDTNKFHQVMTFIRNIECRFKGTSLLSNSKPTNSDPNAMQINALQQQIKQLQMNNVQGVNGQYSDNNSNNNDHSPEINAMSEKKCVLANCGKTFTAEKPYFVCCSPECHKKYRAEKYKANKGKKPGSSSSGSKPPSGPPKSKKGYHNNAAAVNSNNGSGSDSEVSNFIRHNFYITPSHIYTPNSNIPTIVNNSLYDTGASLTICNEKLVKKLGLRKQVVKNSDSPLLGGDKRPMQNYLGTVKFELQIEDSIGVMTKRREIEIHVFKDLNHDLIVGHNLMKAAQSHISIFPGLEIILFEPSHKLLAKFNKQTVTRDHLRAIQNVRARVDDPKVVKVCERLNAIGQTSESLIKEIHKLDSVPDSCNSDPSEKKELPSTSVPEVKSVFRLGKPKFDDNESFILTVPGTKFKRRQFKKLQLTLNSLTTDFMNNFEDSEKEDSALGKVLTEGGFDGLIEKSPIKVENTKIVQTKKNGPVKIGENLSEEMTKKFIKLIDDYEGNVFDTSTLGKTKQTCDPTAKPNLPQSSSPPRYMPLNEFMRTEAKGLVTKMEDLGVLEKSTLPANSTIFIVQKSSGKWRLICDLRKYNDRLSDYVVHLPSPYELINKICKFVMFSYVDFPDAYFSVPLSESSLKHNPIVASVSGMQYNYKYKRMAQGLRPATATFINILNEIYAPIQEFVVNYLDDSVIGSEDDEIAHFRNIKKFIETTDKAGLKISLAKSCFFTKNINFLNYTVSNKTWGISENQKATLNALNIDNLSQKKRESIAAFITHFSRFHTGVANAARQIRDCKTSPEAVGSILENIKKKLVNSPSLKSANFKDDLLIFTDASDFDCSGVVFQKSKDSKSRFELVTCFSRKLPDSMLKKNIYEKELWCLQQLVKTFRYLFLGNHKKTFFNDNAAVLAAKKSKAPSLNVLFNFIESMFTNVVFKFTPTKKNAADIFTRNVIIPTLNSLASERTKRNGNRFTPQLRDKIMMSHKKGSCADSRKLLLSYQSLPQYSWIQLSDIEKVLAECDVCKSIENHRKPRKSSPGITLSKETGVNDVLFIDHKKVITKKHAERIIDASHSHDPNFVLDVGKHSVLTIFEPISRLLWFYPVDNYTTETVQEGLMQYFMAHGPTKTVVGDNAPSFTALETWLRDEYQTQLCTTSVYHPNSNLSERCHAEVNRAMEVYDAKAKKYKYENWQNHLTQAVITINSLKHPVHRYSPYEIYKHRVQSELEPVRFHPTGCELIVSQEKFTQKVGRLLKSTGKIVLPVFYKGQKVKIKFKDQQPRYGAVTSTADKNHKMAVLVKIDGERKAISVNKDFICLPRYKIVNPAAEMVPANSENDNENNSDNNSDNDTNDDSGISSDSEISDRVRGEVPLLPESF